mgnify:CR=1 FL=1
MNNTIEKFLKERLVSDVGFALCEDSPFEGLCNAVSMVFKLSDAVIDQIDVDLVMVEGHADSHFARFFRIGVMADIYEHRTSFV